MSRFEIPKKTEMSSKGITLRIDYPEGRSRVSVGLEGTTVKDLRDEVEKVVRFIFFLNLYGNINPLERRRRRRRGSKIAIITINNDNNNNRSKQEEDM